MRLKIKDKKLTFSYKRLMLIFAITFISACSNGGVKSINIENNKQLLEFKEELITYLNKTEIKKIPKWIVLGESESYESGKSYIVYKDQEWQLLAQQGDEKFPLFKAGKKEDFLYYFWEKVTSDYLIEKSDRGNFLYNDKEYFLRQHSLLKNLNPDWGKRYKEHMKDWEHVDLFVE